MKRAKMCVEKAGFSLHLSAVRENPLKSLKKNHTCSVVGYIKSCPPRFFLVFFFILCNCLIAYNTINNSTRGVGFLSPLSKARAHQRRSRVSSSAGHHPKELIARRRACSPPKRRWRTDRASGRTPRKRLPVVSSGCASCYHGFCSPSTPTKSSAKPAAGRVSGLVSPE